MPHKNSDKEPVNQRVVQSVNKRYEEQQNTPGTKGQNQSRYEPMTELSPRTMCALLGELTQDVIGQWDTFGVRIYKKCNNMPHKNSNKEPVNQRVVQYVNERYEEQQNTLGTEGQNQSRYEPMTELSPRTMRTLLDELTQDVVGQVILQNVHDMEKFIQNENIHYDNMAKQLGTLNELMNKLVGQICQPNFPSIGNHFQARTIVGHNSPVLSSNQEIEPPFIPSTSNSRGRKMENLDHSNGAFNLGGGPTAREIIQNIGQNVTRVNNGANVQVNGNNVLNNGNFATNPGPNNRPQMIPPVNQPIGVSYDLNVGLRNQIAEIMQDQMAFGMRPFIRPTYRKPYPDLDAIESGRITFEAKKKMAVDENPFPWPLGINMITTGFKSGLPKFKLVVDNGEEDPEPHPSIFECLKGKEGKRDERILCARCSREENENVEKTGAWGHHHRPSVIPNFQPIRG
ncbi:putative retroelement [Abeliophyllum distichum]|uniref:Retroelement n=1 Tax=Abeliophyllum distichum TaxID=126358 RepID=A0ABD1PRC0_9LAMI